jgi:MoxR-like ATPase
VLLLHLDLPLANQERAILDLVENETIEPPAATAQVIAAENIREARLAVARVHLAPALKDFFVRLVMATRPGGAVAQWVEHPVSPRGTLALAACVRARAWLHGRDHGLPEDAEALAGDTLAHRLVPSWAARAEGRTGRTLIADVLREVRPW